MKRGKLHIEQAGELFLRQKVYIESGGTKVYEVKSFPLDSILGVQRAIQRIGKGSVAWQHTYLNHFVCMYIPKNQTTKHNRDLIDLYASGIDTIEKFQDIWYENNNDEYGYIPKPKSRKTSSIRRTQASYIVSDFSKGENKDSKINGSLSKNTTHRTHLISFRAIGIESHKGLIIDYDGWLNTNDMANAENDIIKLNREMDIIWKTEVYRNLSGLIVRYIIYDYQYNIIYERKFCDDRWNYLWKY